MHSKTSWPVTFAISLFSAATLSQYDSLTQAQCDNIVSKLQMSLQMVDMPVVAEVLYADKILTSDELEKLQNHSLSGRPRWLLTALRCTGKHGLKSFHYALQKTGGVAAQHREMLLVLVAKGVYVCACVFLHVSVLTHVCARARVCVCVCVCVCVEVGNLAAKSPGQIF